MDTRADKPVVSGLPREHNRLRWAMAEFLLVPLLIVAGLAALAALAIALDRASAAGLIPLRESVAGVIPTSSMASAIQTIAPGLLTAISITFFVMVMTVNQQAGTYTTAVIDQFLQRRLNQVFFGLFVGLAVYFVAVLALVPTQQMVLSATIAWALTLVGLALLLVFIYNVLDQLRPSSSAAMIEHIALRARATQKPLLARCSHSPQLSGEPATLVTLQRSGYICALDVDVLATGIDAAHGPVEIEFHITQGAHIVPGDTVAEVRGRDRQDRERLASAVLGALTLGRMRDITTDAGYSVEQLATMAWAASSSQQDPQGASVAVGALHGLLAYWGDGSEPAAEQYGGRLPIIYNDEVTRDVLDALTAVITATGQSGQHQTCAEVLTIFSDILPRLPVGSQQEVVDEVSRVLSTVTAQVLTLRMERAIAKLRRTLYEIEYPDAAARLEEIEFELHRQVRELVAP